jgi:hypothetical protein
MLSTDELLETQRSTKRILRFGFPAMLCFFVDEGRFKDIIIVVWLAKLGAKLRIYVFFVRGYTLTFGLGS